MQYFC